MLRITLAFIATLLCAVFGAAASADQPSDWSGYYEMAKGKDLAGFTPLNPNNVINKVVADHLQPWARAKMEATDGVADDVGAICQPNGMFKFPVLVGEFLWLPGKDRITIVYYEVNTAGVRRIYLNRKEHPRNLLPTYNGDSIGHWEGDTLVVDTVGFNEKSWLMGDRQPHTEETHLIERFRRVGDGLIEVKGVVEDRQALTYAYAYSRYYKRKKNSGMEEHVCAEDAQIWRDWRNEHLRPQLERSREVK